MSFVTTCTQCSTRFVIKPEQLAVRKGRVRCGSCQHVFNALLNMQEVSDAATDEEMSAAAFGKQAAEDSISEQVESEVEPTQIESRHHPFVDISDGVLEQNVEAPLGAEEQEQTQPGQTETDPELAATDSDQETRQEAAPDSTQPEENEPSQNEPSLDAPLSASALETATHDTLAMAHSNESANDSASEYSSSASTLNPALVGLVTGPAALEQIAVPDKLDPYKRDADILIGNNKRASPVSTGWFLILVLLLIAAVQSVYFLRTSISSTWPATKPYFVTACTYIGCKVDLPKNADLLLLDDSDLLEDPERQGLIHLNSTLVNSAPYAQDYPLLEVTLTDTKDAPVLRRTFKPAEYLTKGTNLAAGLAAKDEVHIHLALSADEKSVSGYRVFVTY